MHNSGLPGTDQAPSHYTGVALTEQLIIQHLKQCRDLSRGFAYRVFPPFWRQWCKEVLERAEQARSNKEQVARFETHNLLTAVQQAAEQEFCQHLANGFVKFKNKSLHTLTGEERFSGDILSLVEHSDLEETIAISSITHRADNFFGEQLWSLQQRMALLNDGQKIDERANPASPVQFCEALRKVLSNMEVDIKTKIIGYKIFDQEVIGQLDSLYHELNDYLIRQNLLPNLRFVPGADHDTDEKNRANPQGGADEGVDLPQVDEAPASNHQRRASDKLLSGTLSPNDIQYQTSLLNAIRLLQTHVSQHMPGAQGVDGHGQAPMPASATHAPPVAAVAAANPVNLQVYSQNQLVGVIDNMQSHVVMQARDQLQSLSPTNVTFVPVPVAEVGRQMMESIAKENANGAVEAEDMQTIDLVGLLFEYMLSDDHLPDSVKALLSYLHTPFLKIAFIDKSFFEQPDHPARVLLNSLAEAGVRWVSNDGSDQYDIFTKIKTTVFRLLQEFKNDVRLFAELLLEFNTYTRNVARRQELMEKRALEKAQGEEKLREAKIQVNNEVRRRTDGKELPSAVLLLLLQPWSDFLSFVLLRYGDKSESWTRALQTIDDLLWSIQPKATQDEKSRQVELESGVTEALEVGFETIGYERAKGRKLIEAVSSLQRMALLSRKAEPAPEPMRSKLETMAAEKAGQTLIDLSPATAEESKMVDSLKMVEFGTWFEFVGGKRLKVAWYNKKTQHYMLVDQQGRKVSLTAGLQLARDMISGKAKVIAGSTKPFFERALENIYHKLNERAETLKIEKI